MSVDSSNTDPGMLPVDFEMLCQRCLGNRKLAAKALGKFQETVATDLAGLTDGVSRQETGAVASLAHKIKGSAANVSADAVRRLAGELEMLAKTALVDEFPEQLARLRFEVDRMQAYITTLLAGLPVATLAR